MRYLAEPFIVGALRRGRAVEQFLGPVGSPGRPGVRYIEVRPARSAYEVYVHAVLDRDPPTFDLDSLPPLIDGDEECFGLLVAATDDPDTALAAAEASTGAVGERWVNHTMAGDEYRDYVLSGRPSEAPDGRPWPPPPDAAPSEASDRSRG